MQILEALSGFALSLVLIILLPVFEDELSQGYRMKKYCVDSPQTTRIYQAYAKNQRLLEFLHKIMLLIVLLLPCYLVWIYLDFFYAPPLFVLLLFIYRRSLRRLPELLRFREIQRMEDLVVGVIEDTNFCSEKGDVPKIEYMMKKFEYLTSSDSGGPNLSATEIEEILMTLKLRSDEIGMAAAQILKTMK